MAASRGGFLPPYRHHYKFIILSRGIVYLCVRVGMQNHTILLGASTLIINVNFYLVTAGKAIVRERERGGNKEGKREGWQERDRD